MVSLTPSVLNLDDLARGMPGITPAYGASLSQAALVCLDDQNHSSGVDLRIDGDYNRSLPVIWSQQMDDQIRRTWAEHEDTTEQGAYGIAALLIIKLTDLIVLERSRRGTGFDYWLGPADSSDLLFQNKSRLEVTGIRSGGEAELKSRMNKKINQVKKFDYSIPAYIIVVEFSRPQSRIKKQ